MYHEVLSQNLLIGTEENYETKNERKMEFSVSQQRYETITP
jgi:hypothetical protein